MAPSLSRIMNWNICSGNKRKDPLIEFLRSQGVDVCIITETHLNKDIEFTIDGYHVVRKDRITVKKNTRRGGVMILIRNGISFQQIEIKTSVIESVGIEVKLANKKLKIYAVYCPEQCYGEIANQFTSDLQMLTRSQDKFLVIGDLNAKSRKWSDNEENRNGPLLLEDISIRGGYEVKLPKEPTFVKRGNASYLDICLTNLTTEHDDRPVTVSTLCSDHHYPTIWDIGEKVRDVASRQEEHHRDENDRQVRVLHPGPGLESVEDADIGLEVLCQAIETVIRSSVRKIAAEAHNLFLINTTIKDNGITDITRNQLAITGATLKTRVLSSNAITRVLSSMVKNMPKTPSDVLNAILSQLNSDGAIQKVRYPSNSRIGERSAMVMELFQHLTAIRRMQKNVSGRRRACLANPLESVSLHHDQALFLVKSLAGFRPSIRTSREQQTDDTQYCNLRERLEKRLSENRASSSTMAIFILREIRRKSQKRDKKSKKINPNIHVLFVNLSSSYASINRESLWEFLSDCLSKNLIQQVRTVVDRTTPDLQDDELSRLPMAIAMDKVIREATTKMDLRIICYEDDVVLIAKNFSELHKAGKNIKKVAKKIGMVNAENVKYLKSIDVDYPQTVSPVDKYEFLGSMFHHDNQPMEEINHRILIGKQVFEQWREILMSPAKTIDEKLDVHKKIITSVLEGLESSALLKIQTKPLEKFEYKVLQEINGLVQTGDEKSYYPTYPTLVQKWLKCGIVPLAKQRMLRLAGQVVQIPENRPAGIALSSVAEDGVSKQWNARVKKFLKEIGFQNWKDWQTEAQDPVKWGRVLDKATEYYSKKT